MQRRNDLEEYAKSIKPLPNDFEEWAFSQFDGFYNFYKGNITLFDDWGEEEHLEKVIYCPVCKNYTKDKFKRKGGDKYTCCGCGSSGYIYYLNKKKNPTHDYQTMWYGDDLGMFEKNKKVFVLRGFVVALVQHSPIENEEQWRISMTETRRLYISKDWYGIQYNYFDWYRNKHEWSYSGADSTNICGPVHPDTYENALDTWAEYSCLDIAKENGLFYDGVNIRQGFGRAPFDYYQRSIFSYLWTYAKDRKLEMLLKLNLVGLANAKLEGTPIALNYKAKNPYDYLRIYKSRLGYLKECNNQCQILKALQLERAKNEHWTEDEVELTAINYHHQADMKEVLEVMTLRQFSNRVNAYCKKMNRTTQEICSLYFDYFKVKKSLGYDMNNSVYQYPKDLLRAHDETIAESDDRQTTEQILKAEKQYSNIAKRYKKAAGVYSYQKGRLMIRPAMSAGEIVEEGRTLHHCVGNEDTGYLRKHNMGEDIILVLRSVKTPDKPYVTVELTKDGELNQWYGIHDSKPNQKTNDNWLKAYIKQLDINKVKNEMKKAKGIKTA